MVFTMRLTPGFCKGLSPGRATALGRTALHPLQGERQVRASSAETGEGSSGQPPRTQSSIESRDTATATSPAESPAADDAYADVPGFCKSATLQEIHKHGHVLTPGRYVGAEPQEDDGEPFEEKMARLTRQWREQQAEARRLDAAIAANLVRLGFLTSPGDSIG